MISVVLAAAAAVISPSGQSASVKVKTAGLDRPAVQAAVERAAEQACLALATKPDTPIAVCVEDASERAMRRFDQLRARRALLASVR